MLASQARSHWFKSSIAHHIQVEKVLEELQQDIKLLEELQSLDSVIQGLETDKNTVPPDIVELREKISVVEAESGELEKEFEELRTERRQKEREVDVKIEALTRFRTQKNEIKSNEAYSALLKEMEEVEGEKARLEENILMFMERTEEVSGLLGEKKDALTKYKEELTRQEEEDRKRIAGIDEELLQRMEQRDSTAVKVNAKLFSQYERVRKAKDGLGFVVVKDGICQGCFMELPPQVVNELMKGDKVVACERCSRLLYWKVE